LETSTLTAEQEAEQLKIANKKKLIGNLKTLGEYNKELTKVLPKETFKREPTRLKYGIFFMLGIFSIVFLMTAPQYAESLNMPIKLGLSILMGIFLGGNAFMAHETLHGSIVKNRNLQDAIGFVGFISFFISPTYWRFWHNNLHHGNTQLLYKDPDAFPTLMVWKKSKFMKWAFPFTPGSGHIKSYTYFFWWFTFQAVLNQTFMRFGNKMWDRMNHKKVTLEFTMQATIVLAYIGYIGPENWLWLLVIPFMVQNYTVMSYISTNHNISPYTRVNDPLANSLTVTNNPILEFLHMNFGYHTEHHLFASMPMSKAKIVHNKLKEMYPDRFMVMTKKEALKQLYKTPRIYKNRETLVHPETGEEFATIK